MDKAARAPERAAQQAPPIEVSPEWAAAQDALAADSGLALLLVEGHQPPSLHISNNNSICRAFQTSPTHAHRCDPFCGEAFDRAMSAKGKTDYRCHAGLQCFAAPASREDEKPLAVIGGRAFLRSADYRALAERIRTGDLTDLLSAELFRNVVFASQQDLDELASRVAEAASVQLKFAPELVEKVKSKPKSDEKVKTDSSKSAPDKTSVESAETHADAAEPQGEVQAAPRVRNFTSGSTFSEACAAAVNSLQSAHGLKSLALMFRSDDQFHPLCVTGNFKTKPPRITLRANEIKLLQAATHRDSIAVPAGGRTSSKHEDAAELFPLVINEEIKGALLVGDKNLSDEQRQALSAFCREIAMPLEMLRLREELERRMRAATHLQAFNEIVNTAQPDDAYASILRHSTDLLRAERSSLLLYDERANELSVKAAVGPRADVTRETRMRLGEGVAGSVLREGRPVVVHEVGAGNSWHPAPAERSYKTSSFISYPIIIGGRKVGVLNMTDKVGGGAYDEYDLGLLEIIAPQMALAIDRAEWHQKATQFQLLSITDPLTGLLNRRYLEERLSEELERSKRQRFPMSFLMMDIDDFKNYNDQHGHQAGDLALEMTAQCLKTALRSADVAARYGGEEFSILLPQTSLSEARVIAERIRRRVERTHYPQGKEQPLGAVTVSIGISAFGPQTDTPASVIYAADQALYIAKSRGKNCVEAFEPTNTPEGEQLPGAERNAG
ncbi:MAG: diguanylate cyclase [Acidobacteria bacterium]|nr:diguanylate cyclase [Acidobacteriota bacterium]